MHNASIHEGKTPPPPRILTDLLPTLAAFEDIVQRNVIEIRQYGFGDVLDTENCSLEWSAIQFWEIVKRLAVNKSVSLSATHVYV